jgi:hypothetical protein
VSKRFRQTISPDLTYVLAPGWFAVEDLLFGEDGKPVVPSAGLMGGARLAKRP